MGLIKQLLNYILTYYNRGRMQPTVINEWLERLIFLSIYKYLPDFRSPQNWAEFIVNRKLYGNLDELALVSDKLEVRQYVAEKIGEKFLTKIFDVTGSIHEIDEERYLSYPQKFVAKPNMASKRVFINKVRDYTSFKEEISGFLDEFGNTNNEFHYKRIPKKLIIEELLLPVDTHFQEIKCWVFHGKTELLAHSYSIYEGEMNDTYKYRLYDRDWEEPPVQFRQNVEKQVDKPKILGEIIETSETLAEGWDFIRVDLYLLDDNIKFGELTPTPSAGRSFFFTLEDHKYVYDHYLMKKS